MLSEPSVFDRTPYRSRPSRDWLKEKNLDSPAMCGGPAFMEIKSRL